MDRCTRLKMNTHTRSTWPTWISSPQAIPNSLVSSKTAKTRIKPSRPKRAPPRRTTYSKRSLLKTRQRICAFLRWAP